MSSKNRSGTRFGSPRSETFSTDVVNADPFLGDETSNSNDGTPSASKKPRIMERKIHFTRLKLHTRLIIYDYVGSDIDVTWPTFEYSDDFLFSLHLFDLYLNDEKDPRSCYGRMTVMAYLCGDLEALQYLYDIDDNPFVPGRYNGLLDTECNMESICYILGCSGHWKSLQWAITKQYPRKKYVLAGAVKGGADMAMLEWLESKGCQHSTVAFAAAVKRGDMDVMRWLRNKKCPMSSDAYEEAALHGDLRILKWLQKANCPWDESVFRAAAKKGDIKILLWLRMEKCPWNSETFNQAIESGVDIVTLRWFLHEDESLMDEETFLTAVRRGDKGIMKWLHSKDCEMGEDDFSTAVDEGVSFDMLKCMHKVGCPWNEDTFEAAVGRGDLNIVKWMHQNKCPWDARCINNALEREMVDIVQWLYDVNCPHDSETYHHLMGEYFSNLHE